jgi:hypothetical protein
MMSSDRQNDREFDRGEGRSWMAPVAMFGDCSRIVGSPGCPDLYTE